MFLSRWMGLLLLGATALANSPAPIEIGAQASGALQGVGPGLRVLSEKLRFHCHFGYCDVLAIYELEAKSEKKWAFRFMMPSRTPIKAMVGGQALATSEPEPAPEPEQRKQASIGAGSLFQASFEGTVPTGKTEMSVSYRQPLSAHIRRGYLFSSAGGSYGFSYLLGPLKQWERADDFTLRIAIQWELPHRGFFKRLLAGGKREIRCQGNGEAGVIEPAREDVESIEGSDAENQIYEAEFHGTFPDVLTCDGDVSPDLNRVFDGQVNELESQFRQARLQTE